jgi:hypothetical protein
VLEQKLCVDQQLPQEDPGPEPQTEGVEGRDAETDGRPDGGDGRCVPQRLPELGRAEVEQAEGDDGEDVADRGTAKGEPRGVRSELSWNRGRPGTLARGVESGQMT